MVTLLKAGANRNQGRLLENKVKVLNMAAWVRLLDCFLGIKTVKELKSKCYLGTKYWRLYLAHSLISIIPYLTRFRFVEFFHFCYRGNYRQKYPRSQLKYVPVFNKLVQVLHVLCTLPFELITFSTPNFRVTK